MPQPNKFAAQPNERGELMAEETLPAVQAVPEGAKAVTKYTAEHGREIGLPSPEAINYMASVANMLASSALVTKDLLPDGTHAELRDQVVRANMMAKMLVGHELGIPAIQALQEINIVKGNIFIRYPQLVAQLEGRKGYTIEEVERTHERAAIILHKAGHKDQEFEFTAEDAKKARLNSDQYSMRPRVMLWARCISEAYRATGGQGNVYSNEERDEVEAAGRERGDGSSQVFAEHAKETNPYNVGTTETAAPPEIAAAPAAPVVDVKAEAAPAAPAAAPVPAAVATPEPKAAAQPAAVDNPPAPAAPASNVVQMPNPEPPAPTIPAPAPPPPAVAEPPAPAPPPPPPPATEKIDPKNNFIRDTLNKLSDHLSEMSPVTAGQKMILWLGGYFGIANPKSLPKTESLYTIPLRILEAILKDESTAGKTVLVKTPKESGVLAGTGWRSFLTAMDEWSWSEVLKAKALDVVIAMEHAPSGGMDTKEWLEFNGIEKLTEPNADTFMDMALRVQGQASKLIKLCSALKTTPHELVKRWAIDIETAPKEGLLALLNQDPATAAKAPPVPAADTPPTPPPAEVAEDSQEEFDMTLFDMP